ncbi:MAG: hypothetical protein HDS41_07245 [Bacteroides sp.]|nr:hypothetical protein [Bacteroides sp.]
MNRFVILVVVLVINMTATFAQKHNLSVEDVFEAASRIAGFEKVKYMDDSFNFPKNLGKPSMIIHGNAEPREAVLSFIAQLPDGSIVYDDTDKSGRFDRLFLDQVNYYLLYVHIGISGNDSVLILFKGGKRKNIDKFINKITAERRD